jgi:OmcA/MtrC family decaheme c-type cytochrome
MGAKRGVLYVLAAAGLMAIGLGSSACGGETGLQGPPGDAGESCTVVDNGDGTITITCLGGDPVTVSGGESCTAVDNGDGTITITCPGSDPITISGGEPCTVVDNGDGTMTITCPDGSEVTVANGTDGTSCTAVDNGDGTITITCPGSDPVTVSDGAPCTTVDNGDGTITITCPGSDPVTVSNGTSCTVIDNGDGTRTISCTDGTTQLVAPPIDTHLAASEPLPGVVVSGVVLGGGSGTGGSFAPGDTMTVTFRLELASGRILPVEELDFAGIWISGPTTNYQRVVPAARDELYLTDVAARSVLNADGTYTYTFAAPLPANYGVPVNDTTKFTDGEVSGPLAAGTYTVSFAMYKNYWVAGVETKDAGGGTQDFLVGSATTLAPREVVKAENCQRCHEQFRFHEGIFRSPTMCATCHTAGAEDDGSTDTADATPVTTEIGVMIHKLHNGAHLPSVLGVGTNADGTRNYAATATPYVVGTEDFSAITYPAFPNFNIQMPKDTGYSALAAADKTKDNTIRMGVTSCGDCHGDPDGSGPVAAPVQGDQAYSAPTRRTCGSCHDDLDYTRSYAANGATMAPDLDDSTCAMSGCHPASGRATAVRDAHLHPVLNPTASPETTVTLTGVTGGSGTGGKFAAGDSPSVTFTLHDAAGADVPITWFDSFSLGLTGPTFARQVVIPGALTSSPIDISGRLNSASTTNKGIMSKVFGTGTPVSETLTVQFTSATAFTVTGTTSGALGGSALSASPGTNPSGSSIANVVLSATAVAQTITVAFTSPTVYTVTGSVSGAMGGGTLPASLSNTQRFTSTDGTVSFNIVLGTTAAAAGNNIYIAVFKGATANPVLFAIVGGRTAFATGDRFYFDYVAPAATYTLKVPMDLQFEYLGDGDGTTGQVLTAGNIPVWYGRQTLYERTATPGTVMTASAATIALARYAFVGTLDAGVASNDYVVIEDGTANEEYARVSGVDATLRRLQFANPLRYAHASGAAVQEVTLTFRQEGTTYNLSATAGTVTFPAATTAGNAFVMTYRTDGRFGWKRKFGDTLQTWYYAPLAESAGLDQTWGDWRGKPLLDGTYTVSLWGYHSTEYTAGGEWQTYRDTTLSSLVDFLYGTTATVIAPYDRIESDDTCYSCHNDIRFHGGGRRGGDACLICHATPGPAVHYRTLAHEFHAEALPVLPNGAANCASCHGSTEVFEPPSRAHPTAQTAPARDWTNTCTACHTSSPAVAHAEVNTSASGAEACAVCHGAGTDIAVEQVHAAR